MIENQKKIQQVIKNDCLFNNCLSNKLSETIAYIVLAVNSYMGNTILLRWLVLTMLKSFQFLNKYFDWEPKKNPTRYQKQLPIQQLPIQQVIKNNCLYWARSSEFLCGKHNLATLIGSYNGKKCFNSHADKYFDSEQKKIQQIIRNNIATIINENLTWNWRHYWKY